jgi:hypothetical protein
VEFRICPFSFSDVAAGKGVRERAFSCGAALFFSLLFQKIQRPLISVLIAEKIFFRAFFLTGNGTNALS